MDRRPVSRHALCLDHGRGQFAEFSSLAEVARDRKAGAHRGRRPPGPKPLCRSKSRRPGAWRRPHPGKRRRHASLSQAPGMGFPAWPQVPAVVDCAARLAWNFAWQKARQEKEVQAKSEDILQARQSKDKAKGQTRNKQIKKQEDGAKKPAAQNWQEATLDAILCRTPEQPGRVQPSERTTAPDHTCTLSGATSCARNRLPAPRR